MCIRDRVKLEYDGDMLKTVTTPSGAVYTYRYGDNGRITETVKIGRAHV